MPAFFLLTILFFHLFHLKTQLLKKHKHFKINLSVNQNLHKCVLYSCHEGFIFFGGINLYEHNFITKTNSF